jgi:hypothetical protein
MSADTPKKKTVRPEENGTHPKKSEKESPNTAPQTASKSNVVPPINNACAAKRKKKCWLQWWRFSVEVLTLVVISIYTGIAYHQWDEMRKAVNLTREQVHVGQRAYLVFNQPVLDNPRPTIGKLLSATIELTNSGQTPALGAKVFLDLHMRPSEDITYGELTPLASIGAGRTMRLHVSMESVLSAEDLTNVMADLPSLKGNALTIPLGSRLYLHGIVRYKDVFKGDGESEFCAAYIGSRNAFAGCRTHGDLK